MIPVRLRLLAALLALLVGGPVQAAADLTSAVETGIWRDEQGQPLAIFGLAPEAADEVLLLASKVDDPLPPTYRPADLVSTTAVGIPSVGV